jgi:hypothetical protein
MFQFQLCYLSANTTVVGSFDEMVCWLLLVVARMNDRPVTVKRMDGLCFPPSREQGTLGLRKGESEIPNIITKAGPTAISKFRSSERYVVFPQTKSESVSFRPRQKILPCYILQISLRQSPPKASILA